MDYRALKTSSYLVDEQVLGWISFTKRATWTTLAILELAVALCICGALRAETVSLELVAVLVLVGFGIAAACVRMMLSLAWLDGIYRNIMLIKSKE